MWERSKRQGGPGQIAVTGYHPPQPYTLDLEILSVSALRRRVSANFLRKPERITFHLLICVTSGRCSHMVDFRTVECVQGSVVSLHPGQVQRYDVSTGWQGWLVLFRPEFLQPQETETPLNELDVFRQLDALPSHLQLQEFEHSAVVESIARMSSDTQRDARAGVLHALLRTQLHAMLIRLHLAQARREGPRIDPPALVKCFRRYRLAVEEQFQKRHTVAGYAKLLGCSEKSLGRAVQKIAGITAKEFLSQRIALEAKRLLVHTALPVSVIADHLGFDEPTNFVKFFRREVRQSPGAFRAEHTL
ncbi:MAG: transcriptional regulator, AraC family [Gammaproteobacteria bacterium]|nr:transcriptional regulator, AraC family [Gammaproteobacteria bacterium]